MIAPILLLVSALCWLVVFALPMAKVMFLLVSHLRRHPLSMTFHSDLRTAASRRPGTPSAQVLLCTYRAWGWEYYKYTIDGTNIFLFNLIFVVFFTIADEYLLAPLFHHKVWFVHPAVVFPLALASVIPLAYFIGMAVASISAQSSMGMGATINAFFGSVIEVFLYTVALTQGKARLVEGSVVGSIFAGCLAMPGISMLFGAFRRKTQRFNAKSAGVTSTMLLFAVIGAFAPTLFYQIYGTVCEFDLLF
jgi:Ca2+:H+ antiporter